MMIATRTRRKSGNKTLGEISIWRLLFPAPPAAFLFKNTPQYEVPTSAAAMWTTKVMTATAIALLTYAIAILTAKPIPLPGLDGLHSYDSQEAQHQRQVFFVGGKYQTDPLTNLTLFVNQMYTEQLIPANGVKHPNPLIFFHGGTFSGAVRFPTSNHKKPLLPSHSGPLSK